MESFDAKGVEQESAGIDLIGCGEGRKSGSPALPCVRVDRCGASGAIAAAKVVRADNKKAVCIEGFARAYEFLPPPFVQLRLPQVANAGDGASDTARMVGAGKSVEKQDGVRTVFIQFAP